MFHFGKSRYWTGYRDQAFPKASLWDRKFTDELLVCKGFGSGGAGIFAAGYFERR
jgi:hypothetical protein